MTQHGCARELEIADCLLASGPEALTPALRRHVEECAECRELMTVIDMLRQDHARAEHDVTVPAAGQVWWRAAVRARLEAAQAAARPMTWAQGVTAATLAGVTGAALFLTWPSVRRVLGLTWMRWTDGWDLPPREIFPPLLAAVERSLPFGLVVIAAVVLTPLLVLYFALAGED